MSRITVPLSEKEMEALVKLAQKDLRHPRQQAAFIIRAKLEEYGLLKFADTVDRTQSSYSPAAPAIT